MRIKKLDPSFYNENKHLVEVLDLIDGEWIKEKTRGHGIVEITFKGLVFAIPLRSNIKHKAACFTGGQKGLDFSKALLIEKKEYVSNEDFMINKRDFLILEGKEISLAKRFGKYVNRYVVAKKKKDKHVLASDKYRYTTLKNYDVVLLGNE